jgi:hypothetical protein
MSYPYYDEPTHVRGTVTDDSSNAARSTSTASDEERLIVDAVDKIFLLEPNKHPLVTLLTQVGKVYDGKAWKGSGMLKKSTGNPEFKWFEDFYGGRYAKCSGTCSAAAAQTPTVVGAGSSSGYIFTAGDVILNARTGERMIVGTVAATTIELATRSVGGTVAAAWADGDGIYIIGNVNEENAGARNVNTTKSSPETNYTQIFKTSIAVTGTQKEADVYGPKDLKYQRAKKGTEHALDIERAFWFGEKGSDTGGTQGHPRRLTGGILEFIESGNSYVQNQGGILTAPDFNTFLREAFTYSSGSPKTLICGGIILQALNEIARGQIVMKPLAKSYGMQIGTWVTPFGSINILHNPLFVEDYSGYGFLLDLSCFRYRSMNNRDTKLYTNVQANDIDGQVDQYITECGLERKQAPLCALLKGVEA